MARYIDAEKLDLDLKDGAFKVNGVYIPARRAGKTFAAVISAIKCVIQNAPTEDVAPIRHGRLRVEITTDDFRNKDLAKELGCYREHYFCPYCDIEIGHKTFDKSRQFGQGTVLHNNEFPNYCPNCGAKLDEGVQ